MLYIFWKSGILVRNIWLFWGKNCWGNLFHWDDCGSGKNRDCRTKLPLLSQHLLLGKNSYYTDCFFQKHVYVFSYWSPTAIVVVKLMMGNRYGIGLNVKWPSFRGMEATLWTVFHINLRPRHDDKKPISTFEMRTGISFLRSHVSRQEFLSFNLGIRHEKENRDQDNFCENVRECNFCLFLYWYFQESLLIFKNQ